MSDAMRQDLLSAMERSFGKTIHDRLRFCKVSCFACFYYPEWLGRWTGAAVFWCQDGVDYMDKFFIRCPEVCGAEKSGETGQGRATGQGRGHGTRFFQELSQDISIVWRTDAVLAERFYGRFVHVKTIARHGDYVYQATDIQVDPETLLGMTRIPSAF